MMTDALPAYLQLPALHAVVVQRRGTQKTTRIQTNFEQDFYESSLERVRPSDGIQYRLRHEYQLGKIDFTAVALTKPNVPDLEHLD